MKSGMKTRRIGRRWGEGIKLGDYEIRVGITPARGKGRRLVFVVELPASIPIILLDREVSASDDAA